MEECVQEPTSTSPLARNPTRLRFGQFTLRSLLILMALVAAFFGGRATMMPQLAGERAKRRSAEQRLAAERAKAVQLRVLPFNVPFNRPSTVPVSLEPTGGVDRAERANQYEHERRWRYQRSTPPREGWPADEPWRRLQTR